MSRAVICQVIGILAGVAGALALMHLMGLNGPVPGAVFGAIGGGLGGAIGSFVGQAGGRR